MSAGAVVLLLLVLVALDDRVRSQVWRQASAPSIEVAGVTAQVSHIAHVVAQAARDQSMAHAPMLIFALAAAILVAFMLRT